eukprot:g14578.t1
MQDAFARQLAEKSQVEVDFVCTDWWRWAQKHYDLNTKPHTIGGKNADPYKQLLSLVFFADEENISQTILNKLRSHNFLNKDIPFSKFREARKKLGQKTERELDMKPTFAECQASETVPKEVKLCARKILRWVCSTFGITDSCTTTTTTILENKRSSTCIMSKFLNGNH